MCSFGLDFKAQTGDRKTWPKFTVVSLKNRTRYYLEFCRDHFIPRPFWFKFNNNPTILYISRVLLSSFKSNHKYTHQLNDTRTNNQGYISSCLTQTNTAASHKNRTWHEILWRDVKLSYQTAALQQQRTMNT